MPEELTARDLHPRHREGAMTSTPLGWALRNLRSGFAWKCADAADAVLRFAQRLEPDIDTTTASTYGARVATDPVTASSRQNAHGSWSSERPPVSLEESPSRGRT